MFPEEILVFGSGALHGAVAHVLKALCPAKISTCNEMEQLCKYLAPSASLLVQNVPSVLCVNSTFDSPDQLEVFIVRVRSWGVRGAIYFMVAPSVSRSASRLPVFVHLSQGHVSFSWDISLAQMLIYLANPGEVFKFRWREFCAGPAAWDAIHACIVTGFCDRGLTLERKAMEAVTQCAGVTPEHSSVRPFLEECERLHGTPSSAEEYKRRLRELEDLLRRYKIDGYRSAL